MERKMEIIMALCGLDKEALEKEQEAPIEISYKKPKGANADIEVKTAGLNGALYAGLCELVCEGLRTMHPDDKTMQLAVLDLIYDDAMCMLQLPRTRKRYGPISPDDVGF